MGTAAWTDKALLKALSSNDPLTDEQRSILMTVVMRQAERDAEADRYRWLRPRLQARHVSALSGGARPALAIRVGQEFFDVPTRAGKGYLDPANFAKECVELDQFIDQARTASPFGDGSVPTENQEPQ